MSIAFLPVEEQLAKLERGVEGLYSRDELKAKLERSHESGKALVVKLGLDPTAPDVHLGHCVVLTKIRHFQDLGHRAVIIIGDFTATVGDPTGKSKTRPVLTPEDVERNAQTYLDQVGSILDTSPDKLELRPNREWLAALSFEEVLRLAGRTTVARLLERDTFDTRLKAGDPIGFHELFYPLMQGYDSVVVESDVEIGGTDQTFNNLFGRDLQRWVGQEPQIVITMPILRGLDGVKKMSKSLDNYIGVSEDANKMVQKLFSMSDDLVVHYAELLTDLDLDRLRQEVAEGRVIEAKRGVARAITLRFHSVEDVDRALANLDSDVPIDMQEVSVDPSELDEDGKIRVVKLLSLCGFQGSNRDLRGRVEQGALRVDGEVIKDATHTLEPKVEMTLSFGNIRKKTNWRRLVSS